MSEPARVVRIIDRLNVGGPARHVTWLTAGLDRRRYETTLVTGTVPAGEDEMTGFLESNGVRPIRIAEMSRALSPRDLLVILKLARLLRRIEPAIVHTHKSKAGAVGRAAVLLYRWCTWSALRLRPRPCRVVHTYHGHIFHSYYGRLVTGVFIAIERILARMGTDRIVVLSEQQRREILGRYKVGKPDQHRVVSLGIDFTEIDALPVAEAFKEDAIPRVGIVGRLCEIKNHRMFLDSVAALSREGIDARFQIIGDGHLREPLEARARALGIADRVRFTGFRHDLASIYAGLDIAALTSLNEGTPLTLIEAMGAGLPVISTDVGGVPDLMGDRTESREGFLIREHGVTVAAGDSDAFARGLAWLLAHPEARREMGARGRAFVRAGFARERLIRDLESLYAELL
ncbi:MAG: glycosyltransferase [Blastocatellia bacterium]